MSQTARSDCFFFLIRANWRARDVHANKTGKREKGKLENTLQFILKIKQEEY